VSDSTDENDIEPLPAIPDGFDKSAEIISLDAEQEAIRSAQAEGVHGRHVCRSNVREKAIVIQNELEPSAADLKLYHYRMQGYSITELVNRPELSGGRARKAITQAIARVELWLREERKEEVKAINDRHLAFLEHLQQWSIERFKHSCGDKVETVESFDEHGDLQNRHIKTIPQTGDPKWIQIALSIQDRIRVIQGEEIPEDADNIYPSGLGKLRNDTLLEFHERLGKKLKK